MHFQNSQLNAVYIKIITDATSKLIQALDKQAKQKVMITRFIGSLLG